MRNFSDNKYIKPCLDTHGTYNLNKLLFGEIAPPRAVDGRELTAAIHNMLDMLGFRLYFTGYKYLAAITESYVLHDDYLFETAVQDVAATYRMQFKHVLDNISACIDENREFPTLASQMLHIAIDEHSIRIKDVPEILGALFKRYFNFYLR